MATLLSKIETDARKHLLEATASFWTSDELIVHINDGIKDLWRMIIDLHQEHFMTVDATNVSLAKDTTDLTGVPADVFRVLLLRARDVSNISGARGMTFIPRDYNSDEFQSAQTLPSQDPRGLILYYNIQGAGAPTGAPTIQVAPQITSATNLTLAYIPIQTTLTSSGNNPIPGDSDAALVHYTVAMARAKEREDRSPDPTHLQLYSTHKQNLRTVLTPRQEQEPDVVEALFQGYNQ